jgi:hypothetical protein
MAVCYRRGSRLWCFVHQAARLQRVMVSVQSNLGAFFFSFFPFGGCPRPQANRLITASRRSTSVLRWCRAQGKANGASPELARENEGLMVAVTKEMRSCAAWSRADRQRRSRRQSVGEYHLLSSCTDNRWQELRFW